MAAAWPATAYLMLQGLFDDEKRQHQRQRRQRGTDGKDRVHRLGKRGCHRLTLRLTEDACGLMDAFRLAVRGWEDAAESWCCPSLASFRG